MPGPPPVITVKPRPTSARPDLTSEVVVQMPLSEARRSEHRDAGAGEMQGAEAANEIARRANQYDQLFDARVWAFEKVAVRFRWSNGRRGSGGSGHHLPQSYRT